MRRVEIGVELINTMKKLICSIPFIKKDISIHIIKPTNAHTQDVFYHLLFVHQHVSITVAIIIGVIYRNVRNPNKYVKLYK
jgi:hypothetical protein